MSQVHRLKTWPDPFQNVLDGAKHHEVRQQDRPFHVGDFLRLEEWDPQRGSVNPLHGYTGREIDVRVTHLSSGGTWGLPSDLCVMSIERASQPTLSPDDIAALRWLADDVRREAVRLADFSYGANALAVLDRLLERKS